MVFGRRRVRATGISTGAAALAVGAMAAGAVALSGAPSAAATGASLVRVSLGAFGAQADDSLIDSPSISADGRYVAFASNATNLVAGDTNDYIDVFVRDRLTDTTRRVTTTAAGRQANGASFAPVISANGRWVAYDSYASNLTAGDRNSASGGSDVFLYDMLTRATVRVSAPNAALGLAVSSANGESAFASISADGRYVAYDSTASNLVTGDTNSRGDVFVWDRVTRRAVRASVGAGGQGDGVVQGNGGSGLASISADGRKVAFVSSSSNFVAGDTNGYNDVFVRDLTRGTTVRASVTSDGAEGQDDADEPVISADGTRVAFHTGWRLSAKDTDWTQDVYVRDLGAGTTAMASAPVAGTTANSRGDSYNAAISRDGRYVAFTSFADDLLLGDLNGSQEVYLRDMVSGRLTRLAVNASGIAGSASSYGPAISPDGLHIAFGASAPNLVARDTNASDDVFVYEPAGAAYRIDTVAPRTAIASGPLGTILSRTVTFAFSSNEKGSAFQCRFDGGAWKACGSTLTRTALAKGGHTLAVRAIDRAGNVDATPVTRTFKVG